MDGAGDNPVGPARLDKDLSPPESQPLEDNGSLRPEGQGVLQLEEALPVFICLDKPEERAQHIPTAQQICPAPGQDRQST